MGVGLGCFVQPWHFMSRGDVLDGDFGPVDPKFLASSDSMASADSVPLKSAVLRCGDRLARLALQSWVSS